MNPELVALAGKIARTHNLDPVIVCAVIEQESAWNPWAVRYEPAFLKTYIAQQYIAGKFSATEAYTRAMSWGLMQIMGEVARELGFAGPSLAELCDPAMGIEYGCRKLANCLHVPGCDERQALLRYNGGSNTEYADQVIARKATYAQQGEMA